MFKIADNVDYALLKTLEFYKDRADIRRTAHETIVCGWGDDKKDDNEGNIFNASHSDNLLCMSVNLESVKTCIQALPNRNFKATLFCGKVIDQKRITNLVFILYNFFVFLFL